MEDVPRLGRTSPAEEVVPRLPVPCPLALEGVAGCVWGGRWAHACPRPPALPLARVGSRRGHACCIQAAQGGT